MKRLSKAERVIQTVVTSGLVAGAQFQQETIVPFLRRVLGDDAAGWVVYSVAMILIAAVFHLIGVGARSFFDHAAWARRLVLRDQHVEGWWIDAVIRPGDELTGGIVEIFYRKGGLKISGTTFNRRGKRIGPFNSKNSMFYDNELIYVYTKDPQASAAPHSHGFGTYEFQPSGSWSPKEFNGFFSSRESEQEWRVHGRKLPEPPPPTDDEKGELVRRFLDDYERGSALQDRRRGTAAP